MIALTNKRHRFYVSPLLRRRGSLPSLMALLLGLCFAAAASRVAAEETTEKAATEVSYHQQIEPIFRANCLGCHQGAKQMGRYLMTDFAKLIAGGESGDAAIVPGKPDESYLVDLITSEDGQTADMPKAPAKPLAEIEVELIRRWIEQGAKNDSPESQGPLYTAEQPPVYQGNPSIASVDVSPDGQLIAVAGLHEALLLDANDGTLKKRLVGLSPRINSVRFSPDGKRLAVVGGTPGQSGEIQIWDPNSAELTLSVPFTFDALSSACWSPDGTKLAFGANDNVVRAIDTTTGQRVLFQGAHADWIRDVAFSKDGKHLVTVARDMSCKLTEVETERFIDNLTSITPGALSGGLNSVVMHPSRDEIVVGGADGAAKVYRIFRQTARKIGDDANLIRVLPDLPGRIFSVDIDQEGSRIAAAATLDGKSEVRVWAYDFDGTLSAGLKKVLAKRVQQRNAGEKKQVEEYRKKTTKELTKFTLDAKIYAVQFAPDKSLIVAACDGKLRKLSPEGKLLGTFDVVPGKQSAVSEAAQFAASKWLDRLPTSESKPIDPAQFASITVLPQRIALDSPYAYHQILVTGVRGDGSTVDVTRACQFQSPEILKVNCSGLVVPVTDGKGQLSIKFGQHQQTLDAVVSASDSQKHGEVDFIKDVNPVLSRLGCNQGTCHGAQKGKNGFRLSLRGYDPIFELRALTDDLAARRINPAAPDESLMLRKPLGLTPHEGGVLMAKGDPNFAILRRWIADGSQLKMDASRVTKLEIFPENPIIQTIGDRQQMRLVAHFQDGSTRDVTREAFIESGNSEVAEAGTAGLISSVRRGEAAILARYEGNYIATTLTVMGDRSGYQAAEVESWSRIDELVSQKWKRVKVQPSGLADDASFLRRVTLDLTGLPPTSQEIRDFLADQTPTQEKRAKVVDRLLESEAYVEFWTNKWADLLQVNRKFLGVEGSKAFRDWIRTAVNDNVPYDEFARQIITASGSNKDNPAASYFKVLRDPEDTMENTTHLFLGVRFNCNKCHDHPFERWTQDQYYEMAAYFAQVGLERDPASGDKKIGGTAVEGAKPLFEKVVDRASGDIVHARTGEVTPPAFPYEVPCDLPAEGTRRAQLATWMTAPDNPYFAKSYVNRLWGYLLGVGLIEPIDDIRAGNPPTNPELLDHLAEQFVSSGFDTRSVLRSICNSRVYQLSVETQPMNEDDQLNYSHAMPRRLPAEVIFDSVHRLTGAVSKIPGMPAGARAAAVTDSGIRLADGFLTNLGRPARESACECERSSELQLGPIMALISGPTISGAIADPKNELERLVNEHPDDQPLANEIFLRALGRFPSDAEVEVFKQFKEQILADNKMLEGRLAKAEADWKVRREALEKQRLAKLEATKQQLAARIEAAKPEQDRLAKERQQRIDAANKQLEAAHAKLNQKADKFVTDHAKSIEWNLLRPEAASSTNDVVLTPQPDRSVLASKVAPKAVYTVEAFTTQKNITGIRLEALSDPALPGKGPGLPPHGNFVITEFQIQVADVAQKDPAKAYQPVVIAKGKADFLQPSFTAEATFDGNAKDQKGWAVSGALGQDHWITYQLKEPIANPNGSKLKFVITQVHNAKDHILGKFRISATSQSGDLGLGLPESLQAIVSTPKPQRTEALVKPLIDHLAINDGEIKAAKDAIAKASQAVPRDQQTVQLETRRDALTKETPMDTALVRLRADVKQSQQQVQRARLTAAEDLTWALINSPAFLFNH